MFKNLFVYVKYPSVAGIISTIWIGSGILIIYDQKLPTFQMVVINMIASVIISLVGFRAEKNP